MRHVSSMRSNNGSRARRHGTSRVSMPPASPAGCAAGVTLVELLVVMLIMMLITAIAIPIVAPALSNRQIREAAQISRCVLQRGQKQGLADGSARGRRDRTRRSRRSDDLELRAGSRAYAGDQTSSTMNVKPGGGITLGASGSIFSKADIGWLRLGPSGRPDPIQLPFDPVPGLRWRAVY